MRRTTALLALVTVLVAGLSARAETPSPATTTPPAQPAAVPEAPAVGAPPAAPPPAPAPSLAPEPAAAAPPLVLDERTQPAGNVPSPRPFYRKTWFWGAVGVVLATTAIILVASAGSAGPGTPATDLGNMNAF